MTWRNLTIAIAFLAITGIAYAQNVTGTSASSTPGADIEGRARRHPLSAALVLILDR